MRGGEGLRAGRAGEGGDWAEASQPAELTGGEMQICKIMRPRKCDQGLMVFCLLPYIEVFFSRALLHGCYLGRVLAGCHPIPTLLLLVRLVFNEFLLARLGISVLQ